MNIIKVKEIELPQKINDSNFDVNNIENTCIHIGLEDAYNIILHYNDTMETRYNDLTEIEEMFTKIDNGDFNWCNMSGYENMTTQDVFNENHSQVLLSIENSENVTRLEYDKAIDFVNKLSKLLIYGSKVGIYVHFTGSTLNHYYNNNNKE